MFEYCVFKYSPDIGCPYGARAPMVASDSEGVGYMYRGMCRRSCPRREQFACRSKEYRIALRNIREGAKQRQVA